MTSLQDMHVISLMFGEILNKLCVLIMTTSVTVPHVVTAAVRAVTCMTLIPPTKEMKPHPNIGV